MIKINKSKTADTRTCDFSKVTKEQLKESSLQHIQDVKLGLYFFIVRLIDKSVSHDWTKIDYIDTFYSDFKTGFKKTDWWKMHQETERHHLNKEEYIQDNVNLLDIIEMIVDGIMAGIARSGEYKQEPIDKELLEKAYNNTVKLLLSNVELNKDKELDITDKQMIEAVNIIVKGCEKIHTSGYGACKYCPIEKSCDQISEEGMRYCSIGFIKEKK